MHVGLINKCNIETALDRANALNEAGISVTLYLFHAATARHVGDPDQPVKRLYELELLPPECKVRLFMFPRMRDPRSFAVARRLGQAMRDDGVDVAHIMMGSGELWLAVLASLLRDIPVASTMIVPKPNVGDSFPAFVALAINKLLVYGSDAIIVNGAEQVALAKKLYHIPSTRIVHVPLGARTTAVKWSKRRNSEEPGTVLFFGSAHPHKGLDYLVQAMPIITRQVPDARIVISIQGEFLDHCRRMVPVSSRFEVHEGFVTGDVAAGFFERACLVALPYVSASTSGVLMDALTFGKPVVASSVGCLPEYVKDGVTGLLVPPSDVGKLAEAIVRLLSNNALRQRMGKNAKRWVHKEKKKITIQLISAYEKAVYMHRNT